jgi:hypothetical protein
MASSAVCIDKNGSPTSVEAKLRGIIARAKAAIQAGESATAASILEEATAATLEPSEPSTPDTAPSSIAAASGAQAAGGSPGLALAPPLRPAPLPTTAPQASADNKSAAAALAGKAQEEEVEAPHATAAPAALAAHADAPDAPAAPETAIAAAAEPESAVAAAASAASAAGGPASAADDLAREDLAREDLAREAIHRAKAEEIFSGFLQQEGWLAGAAAERGISEDRVRAAWVAEEVERAKKTYNVMRVRLAASMRDVATRVYYFGGTQRFVDYVCAGIAKRVRKMTAARDAMHAASEAS